MNKIDNTKMPGHCPACGSSNLQAEPLYPYDDEFGDYTDEPGDLIVFCVSCGHFLGEMNLSLMDRMHNYRNELSDWLREAIAKD